MSSTILRTVGQTPMLPGAVRAGSLVLTSGIVAPEVLAGGAAPFRQQAASAMAALLSVLDDAGVAPEHVIRLEAFLASASDFAEWNEEFLKIWPKPGPARTTLVATFVVPGILFEVQATAVDA